MKKYWSDYIHDYSAFHYEFNVQVSNADFKDKILSVDAAFLKAGHQQKLFVYPDLDRIESYLKRRREQFFSEGNRWINLIDFDQFEDTSRKEFQIFLPDSEGRLVATPYHQPFIRLRVLDIENISFLHWSDVENEDDWHDGIFFGLHSNSTIWNEDIGLMLDEGTGNMVILDPAANNRFFAYRIVPRFNSFLRDVTTAIESLGGSVTLGEHDGKQVTERGILLDGQLIFQEDIDAGKIELPR
ncbi:MAG TPA: hypothetical protein VIN08_19625 [Ohtaekwangia sp.]|uniref:hypothetical protein n=1 Tax=Ohtaekwangia sp. TaxID=2066019 RepID=UPI002F922AD1